jgi:hypothetical protein
MSEHETTALAVRVVDPRTAVAARNLDDVGGF